MPADRTNSPLHDTKTWLDLLPPPTCTRVSAFLTKGAFSEDLLHLLEAAPQKADAWFAARSPNRLVIYPAMSNETAARVLRAAPPTLNELHFYRKDHHREELGPNVLRRFSSLSTVIVNDNNYSLQCIAKCDSIRNLTIFLSTFDPATSCLVKTLAALNLETLEMFCHGEYPPNRKHCFFSNRYFFNENFNVLAMTCPELRVLQLRACLCCKLTPQRPLPFFLRNFPRLQTFVITDFDTEDYLSLRLDLPRFTTLHTLYSEDLDASIAFGDKLLDLKSDKALTASQVKSLRRCPRLKELSVGLTTNAIQALPETLQTLPMLEQLHLHWGEIDWGKTNGFIVPACEAMLKVVQSAPSVTEVDLRNIVLPLQETGRILEWLGNRVERFSACIDRGAKTATEAFETVFMTVAKSNQKMISLDVDLLMSDSRPPGEQYAPEEVVRLESVWRYLRRRCPFVRCTRVQKMLLELKGHAKEEVESRLPNPAATFLPFLV